MNDEHDDGVFSPEWTDVDFLITLDEAPPSNLFIYALGTPTLFPGMIAPLQVEGEHAQTLFEQVSSQNRFLGFVAKKDPALETNPSTTLGPEDLHRTGMAGRLIKVLRLPDGSATALVQVLARFVVKRWMRKKPFLIAKVTYPEETYGDEDLTEALTGQVQDALVQVLELMPAISEEVKAQADAVEEASQLADFITAHFPLTDEDRQEIVECFDITERLKKVLGFLLRELRLREIGH